MNAPPLSPPPPTIVGLLLAAGRSRRFGGDKLTAPLPDGVPMVARCAHTLALGTDRTWVLTRPDHAAVQAALAQLPVTTLAVPDADAGMGHTLAAGVRATEAAAGWVVALGDMPALRADTVAAVVQALRQGASIAAPIHQGRRGHPVGLSRAWLAELLALQGDQGARDLLRAQADHITPVPVDDPGCLLDLDTREAWQAWCAAPPHTR